MGKEAVIAGILALPQAEQREIYLMLQEQLGEVLSLSEEQEAELDRRIDRFEKEGSRGEPWEKVYAELSGMRKNAPRNH
jgi:putative addiction module component (TIGR02574 family)